jgi:hypothetical protein
MIELLKRESLWFPAAIAIGFVAVSVSIIHHHRTGAPRRTTTTRALNLFYGCMIGIMASGHLLVVTIRAFDGTLEQGVRWFLYPLGLILAVPAWLLVASSSRRHLTVFNAWLVVAFAAMGSSAPLAVPGVLNLIYLHSTRPWVGRIVVALAGLLYATLLVLAIRFALSGAAFSPS